MGVVRMLAMIFLAVYLIISGVTAFGGITLPMYVEHATQLCAVVSGILILVSAGSCCHNHCHCHSCDREGQNKH